MDEEVCSSPSFEIMEQTTATIVFFINLFLSFSSRCRRRSLRRSINLAAHYFPSV